MLGRFLSHRVGKQLIYLIWYIYKFMIILIVVQGSLGMFKFMYISNIYIYTIGLDMDYILQ